MFQTDRKQTREFGLGFSTPFMKTQALHEQSAHMSSFCLQNNVQAYLENAGGDSRTRLLRKVCEMGKKEKS